MNLIKLKELCNKYTVSVSFNGFEAFDHKVINADKLFEEIHTTSNLTKDEFVKNVNSGDFMSEEYESMFKSIKRVGSFRCKGDEALEGAKSYIECKSLTWLDQ